MDERLPLIGDRFPETTVLTTHGKKTLPGDYKGKWFVLFSHPGDFTPVCTTEFYSFALKNDEFEKLNCKLIGLSVDQVFSHIKWAEWINENLKVKIPFPIIADEMGLLALKLGMLHPSKGTNTVRAVFVIDPEGNIRTMLYYPQELGRNMDEILRIVKALQVGAENKGAMPANWPNNELLGDKIIVSPATDEKTAEINREKYDCYDWWFCYKDMK
ncbi:MAG: peroxiredoxin [Candidatus Muirbacterium halophilum]|nr:peroxiredoxin [Candidatus Muirbacterium halophilum]MCK9474466.1 peroxiredoxin [Candidatus Muirbacterium halophilum]